MSKQTNSDDNDQSKDTPSSLERRTLLKGLGIVSSGLAISAYVPHVMATEKIGEDKPLELAPELQSVPFWGKHQAGVLTPEPAEALFIAYTVVAKNKNELMTLFKQLTEKIDYLTTGGPQPVDNIRMPPPDSGILGETIYPDNLTVTVALGSSLFDERYGLSKDKPRHLVEMPSFPNDALDGEWCDGDIVLQFCANSRETVIHAARYIIKNFPDKLVPLWRMDGFLPAKDVRNHQTPINLFGFKDGTGNASSSDEKLMNELVWVQKGDDEPQWTVGGSYQVIRLIRFRLEFWDRTPLGEQQRTFGRVRATGAPMGKEAEFDDPDFASDPEGKITPLESHMRLAEPRDPERHVAKLRRRSFSYSLDLHKSGQLNMGLVFICFQRNLQTGFIDTQNRLNGEKLEEYIKPFGGGYYFVLPGANKGSYLGQTLLES